MNRLPRSRYLMLIVCLPLLSAGCPEEFDPPLRGPAPSMPYELDDTHPGWGVANCTACHGDVGHTDLLTTAECYVCHGSNGAPELDESHPGWEAVSCHSCHDDATAIGNHGLDLINDEDCVGCHGSNGGVAAAPVLGIVQPGPTHQGWETAACGRCHTPEPLHGDEFAADTCGVCHGRNGGPLRPTEHWVEDCIDCHGGGPELWNEESHDGYEQYSPQGCLNCHPDE